MVGGSAASISGIKSNQVAIDSVSANIANMNTPGHKASQVNFSSMMTSASASSYYGGGVLPYNRQLIDQQGLIQTTNNPSDLGVNGNGMFVVNTAKDGSGDFLYTRAGSFIQDNLGNYVNASNYMLMGWKLDANADTNNANSDSLLSSLSPVNVSNVTSEAKATEGITFNKANLQEKTEILKGSGQTIKLAKINTTNTKLNADAIIGYEGSANTLNYGDSITLTQVSNLYPPSSYTFNLGGFWMSNDITASVLGATTINNNFTSASNGDNFSVTSSDGTKTFTYNSISVPDPEIGQFNNLATLVSALEKAGFSARIDPQNKHLYFGPKDARQSWSMTDNTGTFVAALFNGAGGPPATISMGADVNRFSSMRGLASLINSKDGITATINSPNSPDDCSLSFAIDDPTGALTISATGSSIGAGGLSGVPFSPLVNPATSTDATIFAALGLNITAPYTTPPAYDALGPTKGTGNNMASNTVKANFTQPIQVYDAFGEVHTLQIGFLKIAPNTWAVEVFVPEVEQVITTQTTDGQLASGTITFDGEGKLRTISTSLSDVMEINWANSANKSNIKINWGDIAGDSGSQSYGITQVAADNSASYNKDGAASGKLASTIFDQNGYVIAKFTNGDTRKIFQLPLATFPNVDGLDDKGGNAYSQTYLSGEMSLAKVGSAGVGSIVPSALEGSNVDLSEQLTTAITCQRTYQSCSRMIKVYDEMLEELGRIIT